MTNIILYDINGERVDSLFQWNCNVSIKICGAKTEPIPEILCWNKNSKVANRVKTEISNGFVKFVIPNELLQDCFPINIQLLYRYDSGDSKTEYRFVIPVIPGKKPAGYVYSPSEVATLDSLEERIKNIEENGVSSGGSSGPAYVAAEEPPEDTNALWVDTAEQGEAVALGVTAVETAEGVELYCTDELGTTKVTVRHGKDGAQGPRGEAGPAGPAGPAGLQGAPGDDYVLTDDDVQEIAGLVLASLPTWTGGVY